MKNPLSKNFLPIYLSAFLLSLGGLIYSMFTYVVNRLIISRLKIKNELLFTILSKIIFIFIIGTITILLYRAI